MTSSILRGALSCVVSLLLFGAAIGGCNCGGRPPHPACSFACCGDSDCQPKPGSSDQSTWVCEQPKTLGAFCAKKQASCSVNADCCPGQACNTDIGLCTDSYLMCDPSDPSACSAVPGQFCEAKLGKFPQGPGCTFNTCQSEGDCAKGLTCFDSFCVGGPPCNGGCPANSVCTPVNNSCFSVLDSGGNVAPQFAPSCAQSCMPGTILVFKDGLNVFNECRPTDLECECETLPSITATDTARYSSATSADDKILVSAYDGEHGDLVLHTFEKNGSNDPTEILPPVWIDGVPDTGAVTGDPNGPRGGRADPGPDVGQYTSIAFDSNAGATHISYYAVSDGTKPVGDLKYARRVNDGAFQIMTVDGSDAGGNDTGDVGLYTSITLAPDGSPVIAYFQQAGVGPNALQTAVKVARAKTPTPMSAADWTITTVDTGTATPPPCNDACQSSEQCGVDASSLSGTCFKMASSCSATCGSGEFCGLDASMNPTCIKKLSGSGLSELPTGNGLFPSIAYLDNVPVVVWYDRSGGELKGVIADADSAAQGAAFDPAKIQILDDGTVADSADKHDVGWYTSLAIGPVSIMNRIAVSYFDATSRQLRLLTAKADWMDLTAPDQRVIDDGSNTATPDPTLFVGADSSVQFNGQNLLVVYQDSTGESLRLAGQGSPSEKVAYEKTLDSNEACGFYAKLVVDGSGQFVSQAVISAASPTASANVLRVMRVP